MRVHDAVTFFTSWLRSPIRLASVTPSSAATAALIAREIDQKTGAVVELGPGTGPFTRALIDRGVAEQDLILVESFPEFARRLREEFPRARVLEMDAVRLSELHAEARAIGAVVSGLGLSLMQPQAVVAILEGAFGLLRPDGAFFQLSYHPRCPVPNRMLGPLNLEAKCVGRTFCNLPPAWIYRIARRDPALPGQGL